jgi:hypothetical protein
MFTWWQLAALVVWLVLGAWGVWRMDQRVASTTVYGVATRGGSPRRVVGARRRFSAGLGEGVPAGVRLDQAVDAEREHGGFRSA